MPQGPLRLLILAAQYFPAVGGSEAQTRLLAREFARRGHAVEVWTRRLNASDPPSEPLDGGLVRRLGPIFGIGAPWARRVERLVFFYRLYRELRVRARSFDVILANQLQYPAVAAALAGRGNGVPVVARSATSGPESEMHRREWLFRVQRLVLIRHLARVVALGPVTRKDCEAAGFKASILSVIPNALDLHAVGTTRISGSRGRVPPLRVVWLGKLRKEKRADLAILAWREAHVEGELRVVGDGPLRPSIEALIALGHDDQALIHMAGLLENPRSELASAHVFLQSSDTEGLSNALLEAMSAGCACVATDVGETRYVLGGASLGEVAEGTFTRADAGLLVRPGDIQGMAEALRALMNNELRETLGQAAEARCRANHGLANAARQYEEVFSSLRDTDQRGRAA